MENIALRIILHTWHMTDGFNWIRSSVDDGEHGRDDAKEDTSHDTTDGGDVELVDHQGSLVIHHSFRTCHSYVTTLVPLT